MSPHPRVGREHILDIVENFFAEHSYKSASFHASDCDVTSVAIYYYFSNRRAFTRKNASLWRLSSSQVCRGLFVSSLK